MILGSIHYIILDLKINVAKKKLMWHKSPTYLPFPHIFEK